MLKWFKEGATLFRSSCRKIDFQKRFKMATNAQCIKVLWTMFKKYEILCPILLSLPLFIRFGQLDLLSLGSDTRTHVYKTYLLIEQIKGLPPSLWGSWDWNWYCGYPFIKLYAPLFYYITAFLSIILHLTPEFVTYWIMLLSYPFSAMSMYFLAKYLIKNMWASLLASAIYLNIPFHIANGMVFGNPSSLLTFIFMPLSLLYAEKFIRCSQKRFAILASLFLAASLLTNHAYGVSFFALFLAWFLLRRKVFPAIALVSIATLLSAFFLVPILFYSSGANTFYPVYLQFDPLTSLVSTFQPAGLGIGLAVLVLVGALFKIKFESFRKSRKNSKNHSFKVDSILRVCATVVAFGFLYNVVIFFFPIWPFSSLATGRTVPPLLVFLSILFALVFVATAKEKKKLIALVFILLFVLEGLFSLVYYPVPPSRYEKAFQYLEKDKEWFRVIFLPSEPAGSISPLYAEKPVLDGWFIQGFSPELHKAWIFFEDELLTEPDKALIVARYLGVKYVVVDSLDPIPGYEYSMAVYKALNTSVIANEVFADGGVKIFKIRDFRPVIASDRIQITAQLENAYETLDENSIFMVTNKSYHVPQLSDEKGDVNLVVYNVTQGVGSFSVVLSSNRSAYVLIPVSYSPNLLVKINGKEIVPFKVVPSLVAAQLPKEGNYRIEISVQGTSIDFGGNLISLTTLIVLLVWLFKQRLQLIHGTPKIPPKEQSKCLQASFRNLSSPKDYLEFGMEESVEHNFAEETEGAV